MKFFSVKCSYDYYRYVRRCHLTWPLGHCRGRYPFFFVAKLQSYAYGTEMMELIADPENACITIYAMSDDVCVLRAWPIWPISLWRLCAERPIHSFQPFWKPSILVCCWCYLTAVCHFVIVTHKCEMVPSPDHVLSQAVVVVLPCFFFRYSF